MLFWGFAFEGWGAGSESWVIEFRFGGSNDFDR